MVTTLLYSLLALDQTLAGLASQYGHWLYAILFLVIFAETGLVVFPFLPGDSILFIAGTVVAVANLNVHVLVVVLIVAAVLGDSVNYAVGHYIGPKAFHRPDSRWLKQEYLRRTQSFYDRYGGVKPPNTNRQGIEDITEGEGSEIRLCHDGRWIELTGRQ